METIKVGNFIRINGQDSIGEVIAVKGNDLQVALGVMKVFVKRNKVSLAQPPAEEFKSGVGNNLIESSGIDTKEKLMHFKFELDVRGKMKEDIMMELPVWVDEAILLGIKEAKVVHGRGNGILKNTVRTTLKKFKEVESAGDDGSNDFVTMVKFRI